TTGALASLTPDATALPVDFISPTSTTRTRPKSVNSEILKLRALSDGATITISSWSGTVCARRCSIVLRMFSYLSGVTSTTDILAAQLSFLFMRLISVFSQNPVKGIYWATHVLHKEGFCFNRNCTGELSSKAQ